MAINYILNAAAAPGSAVSKTHYSTVDEALRGAKFRLGNGAAMVWIVDRQGHLVLPADQVAARLAGPETAGAPAARL
jgi:hypothetical protein